MGNSIVIDRNIWKTMRSPNALAAIYGRVIITFLLNAILYSNGYQTSTGLPSRIYHWYTRYCLEFYKTQEPAKAIRLLILMVAGDLDTLLKIKLITVIGFGDYSNYLDDEYIWIYGWLKIWVAYSE
ncbi:unnamed protein product [Rhizophagus irregularis]|nr:unnamed protein product [Rhizophagus irregularis]